MKPRYFSILIILFFFGCAAGPPNNQRSFRSSSPNKKAVSSQNTPDTEDSASIMVNEIAKYLHKLPTKRVTVADFTDIEGNSLEEGKLFAEQVITRMLRHGGFRVIERSRLNKILEEKKLSLSGITQEEEKELATLSLSDRQKVEQEFQARETERQEDPEWYELEKKHKELLQELKRNDRYTFDRVVRAIQKLKQLKDSNMRRYLLLTEPSNSDLLLRIKKNKPEVFQEVIKLRKELKLIFQISPTYRDLLLLQRERMLRKMKRQ